MALRWWSSCRTDAGRRRRINEDAYLELHDAGLWLVADGMGGQTRGDVASRIVIDSLKGLAPPRSVDEHARAVKERLRSANTRVRETAAQMGAYQIMGSTVVALLVFKGRGACIWAGDSRAYLLRDGRLGQITRDHSLAEQMVERGELKREDAARHPTASRVTRAVGTQNELDLDERRVVLQDGDAVLLCTDGLIKEVNDREIQSVLDSYDCEQASQELMDLTLERGAPDNVTVAVIRFEATTGFGDTAMEKTAINDAVVGRQFIGSN